MNADQSDRERVARERADAFLRQQFTEHGFSGEEIKRLLSVQSRIPHRPHEIAEARDHAKFDELLEAAAVFSHLPDYTKARRRGITHQDIMAGSAAGIALVDYVMARSFHGMDQLGPGTHQQVLEAQAAGFYMRRYGFCRSQHLGHEDLMDSHRAGILPDHYAKSRKLGYDHDSILSMFERDGSAPGEAGRRSGLILPNDPRFPS